MLGYWIFIALGAILLIIGVLLVVASASYSPGLIFPSVIGVVLLAFGIARIRSKREEE